MVRYAHRKAPYACLPQSFLKAHCIEWEHGMDKRDITSNINFFMNVPVTPEGKLTFEDGISEPGKYVEMRAEMDVLVLISNCPQLNNPCNGYNPTPVEVLIWDARRLMFRKVLIANRGAIACRIIRTLRAHGHRARWPFIRKPTGIRCTSQQADEAVLHRAGAGGASYLSVAAILDAARENGSGGDPSRLWIFERKRRFCARLAPSAGSCSSGPRRTRCACSG